ISLSSASQVHDFGINPHRITLLLLSRGLSDSLCEVIIEMTETSKQSDIGMRIHGSDDGDIVACIECLRRRRFKRKHQTNSIRHRDRGGIGHAAQLLLWNDDFITVRAAFVAQLLDEVLVNRSQTLANG